MASSQENKSLVLSALTNPASLKIQPLPLPKATPGSAIIEILSSPVLSYTMDLVTGALPYPLSLPLTIGGGSIARIVDTGPDATALKQGDLVLSEVSVHARDDPTQGILLGVFGGEGTLMASEWRHGVYAQYAKVPLESIAVLDEARLVKEMGYSLHDLSYILRLLVPSGGLSDALDVKPGDTLIVAPASGQFGGGAVELAHALGADVIACARNVDALNSLKKTVLSRPVPGTSGARIEVVKLSGDVAADAQAIGNAMPGRKPNKYLDFSPPSAAKSTHIASCLMSLAKGGKACLMGGISEMISIPYGLVMFSQLTIQGKFMYSMETVRRVIGLVETGRVALGEERAGLKIAGGKGYMLEEWKEAFELASKESGWGQMVVMEPGKGMT